MQPGDVVGPGGSPPEQKDEPAKQSVVSELSVEETKQPEQSPISQPSAPEANWQFTEDNSPQAPNEPSGHDAVTWTASEYIAHEKSSGWYLLLGLATASAAAVVFLITREVTSTVVIAVMGVAFGAFAARKPEELTYVLDNTALKVGQKTYPYSQFKSFTIVDEGAINSIMLMPLQRFMPPLSIYFDPADEDKIAEALSSYLPYEDRKPDAVDRLMRKVRF